MGTGEEGTPSKTSKPPSSSQVIEPSLFLFRFLSQIVLILSYFDCYAQEMPLTASYPDWSSTMQVDMDF